MNIVALNQILQQQTAPCFLVQGETHEILLCNQRMERILAHHPCGEHYIGKIFYHVIQEEQAPKNFNPLQDWDKEETRSYQIYYPQGFHHIITATLLPLKLQGELYVLCCYIPSEKEPDPPTPYTSQQALMGIFQILKEEEDYPTAFLEVLCHFYYSQVACFYHMNPHVDDDEMFPRHLWSQVPQHTNLSVKQKEKEKLYTVLQQLLQEEASPHPVLQQMNWGTMDPVTHVLHHIISIDCRNQELLNELYQSTGELLDETPLGQLLQLFQPCFPKTPLTNLYLSVTKFPETDSYDVLVLFHCNKSNSEFYNLLYTATRFLSMETLLRGSKRRLEQENKSKEKGLKSLETRKQLLAWLEQIQLAKKLLTDETEAWLDLVKSNQNRNAQTGFYGSDTFHKHCELWKKEAPPTLGILLVSINQEGQGEKDYDKISQLLKDFHQGDWFHPNSDFNPYSDYCYDACDYVTVFKEEDKKTFEARILRFFQSLHHFEKHPITMGYAWGKGNYALDALMKEAENVLFINKQGFLAHFPWELIEDVSLSQLLYDLETREFEVHLQPQVKLSDYSIHGAEALIRRKDKSIFPDQFIPFYEDRGIIRHIDLFVVETVCALLAEWQKSYHLVPISVNLSRITLMELGIVDTICKIFEKYQVPHQYLVIEVTERMGLVENNVASVLIDELKDKGFKISLDDFGCAYSNLVTLSQISVDEVKMDKSLIDYVESNPKALVMIKNILSMCHELTNTTSLVEGIENEAQARLLQEHHCQLGQGYYFSRPISSFLFFETYIKPRKYREDPNPLERKDIP